ncbi:MAG: DUF433 domain-containing protein [Anaerolineae bacterium]
MIPRTNCEASWLFPVKAGRACIRGMRITVSLILKLMADGMTRDEILESYPYLEPEDIQSALHYAAWLADESIHLIDRRRE